MDNNCLRQESRQGIRTASDPYNSCPNYDVHLEAIRRLAEKYPQIPITLLLYNEGGSAHWRIKAGGIL